MPSIPCLFNLTNNKRTDPLFKMDNVYYVAKSVGADTNDGQTKPLYSIAEAITRILSFGNPPPELYKIEVLDNETYEENDTLPQNVILIGESATFSGRLIQNAGSYLDFFKIQYGAETGWFAALTAGSGTGNFYFNIKHLTSTEGQIALLPDSSSCIPKGRIHNLNINGSSGNTTYGVYLYGNCSNGHIIIDNMNFTSPYNMRGITNNLSLSPTTAKNFIEVKNIYCSPEVTNALAIKTQGYGALEVAIQSGSCPHLIDTANNSELIMIGNDNVSGSITKNSSYPVIWKTQNQRKYYPYSTWTVVSGPAVVTYPPLVTEGTYIFSSAPYTPRTSKVRIGFQMYGAPFTSRRIYAALYIGSTFVVYGTTQKSGNNITEISGETEISVTPDVPITVDFRLGNDIVEQTAINGQTFVSLNLVSHIFIEDV